MSNDIERSIWKKEPSEKPQYLTFYRTIHNMARKTKEQAKSILQLEIETLSLNNPEYHFKQFDGGGKPDQYGGCAYTIIFELKP